MTRDALALVLSGAAALTYQVIWFRWLALGLGATAESAATVVAAFFIGLAAGSALAPPLLRRVPARVLFAGAEILIAAAGLGLVFLLPRLPGILAGIGEGGPAVHAATALAVLLVPTFCMGVSLPAMVAAATREGRVLADVGRLYAANTTGAVIGVAAVGFWWIPALGLGRAAWIAVALNLLAAVLCGSVRATRAGGAPADPGPGAAVAGDGSPAPRVPAAGLALVVLAATGAASIASEIGWTKALALLTGGTVQGFTTILTVFLAGLAIGAHILHRFPPPPGRRSHHLRTAVLLTGFLLLFARAALRFVPAALEGLTASSFPPAAATVLVAAAVLLPPTCAFGATFPLALAVFCSDRSGIRSRFGPAYALNTMASVVASLLAGFWLIPRFGTDAVLAGAAALLFLPALGRPRAAAWAAAGLALAAFGPGLPLDRLVASVRYEFDPAARKDPDFHYLHEGRTGVISVVTYGDSRARLQNNGLNESLIDLEDPEFGAAAELTLGLLPWLLHDDAGVGFVVGFGGAVTVRAALGAPLRRVVVAELEPAVVDAFRTLFGEAPPLTDPRLTLRLADARQVLLRDSTRYDFIVSQPSHPWRAGASALFTEEFFRLGRSRLKDDGLFVQWINLFNMDRTTLASLGGTFYDVFSNGFSLQFPETGDLLLVGSPGPLRLSPDRIAARLDGYGNPRLLEAAGLRRPEDLLARFSWSRNETIQFADGARRNTDDNLFAEFRLASLRGVRTRAPGEDPYAALQEIASFDLLPFLDEHEAADALLQLTERLALSGSLPRARLVRERLTGIDPGAADSTAPWFEGGLRGRAE